MRVLMTHFRRKYDIIEVDDNCIKTMMETIPQPPDMLYIEHLNQPIDIEEIRLTYQQENGKRPPEMMGWVGTFTKRIGRQ